MTRRNPRIRTDFPYLASRLIFGALVGIVLLIGWAAHSLWLWIFG